MTVRTLCRKNKSEQTSLLVLRMTSAKFKTRVGARAHPVNHSRFTTANNYSTLEVTGSNPVTPSQDGV